MNVDNYNPRLLKFKDYWTTVRDCLNGEQAIKDNAKRYVIPYKALLWEHDPKAWESYVQKIQYTNTPGKVHRTLLAAGFANPVKYENKIEGLSFDKKEILDLLYDTYAEDLATQWTGIGLDYNNATKSVNFNLYPAESILDYLVNSNNECIEVRFKSVSITRNSDFTYNETEMVHHLYLNEQGYYSVDVYAREKVGGFKKIGKTINPIMNNKFMNFIPFWIANGESSPSKPAMIDLSTAALHEMDKQTNFNHINKINSTITYFAAGVSEEEARLIKDKGLGSLLSGKNSDASIKVVSGAAAEQAQIMAGVVDARENTARLASNILSPKGNVAETAETMRLRNAPDNIIIKLLSTKISYTFRKVISVAIAWEKNVIIDPNDVVLSMNPSMDIMETDYKEFVAMAEWFYKGDKKLISAKLMAEYMNKNGLLPEGTDILEFVKELELSEYKDINNYNKETTT